MFLVIAMIFNPARAWEQAARIGRNGWRTFALVVLRMLLLGCVVRG